MRAVATLILLILLGILPVHGQERPSSPAAGFTHPGVARDADRYETFLKSAWKAGKAKPADLRGAAEKALGTDARAASRSFAEAVVSDPKSSDSWLGLARALLAITPDPNKASERYDLPLNASGAAYRAYERATDGGARARALAVLGQALERRSYWRPAIDALRASLALADNTDVRASFDRLRAAHGFRMTDYKTESDLAQPRLCLQFSERLKGTSADLGTFVTVGGREPQSLSVEDRQLCIEGLVHGQRYEIRLRAGLPSEVGEALEKSAEIAAYLPDRKPMARFTGRAYVLPARGQQGIPLTSVNTKAVEVEVYRVGDRNLAGVIQSGEIGRQLSSYDIENIREKSGQRVYKGTMEVATRLNEEVTTALPVSEAVPDLKPGAYVVAARPAEGRKGDNDDSLSTQWFVVSDLGLTAFSGPGGVSAFVRSLGDARPVPGASVKLVAKNNEVLATANSDAQGHVRFDGALIRGEGGAQPAILVADKDGADYAFLDLTTAAFDLSDRGVKGRDSPGALDAYLYAERGVYRPGEEVNVTGLVRDGAGNAAALPVTLIVARPDGVEWKRMTMHDHGLGGRHAKLDIGTDAMTGTWRARLHADPKGQAIASIAFLVEDFVPERLDMTLVPGASALRPEEPAVVRLDGRYLYGPPAAGLAIEADIVVKPSVKDVPGYPGFRFGLADEKVTPVRKAVEGLPQTDAAGKADLTVTLPAVQRTARPLEAELIVKLREQGGRSIERTVALPVDLGQPRIGIKPLFEKSGAEENAAAGFEVVMLDGLGKRIAGKGLAWSLYRLDTSWQWYSRDGSWAYEPITLSRKAATGTLDAGTDTPARLETRVGWGRYRLDVAGPDGALSSVVFNAGWYSGGDAPDSPEMLDVALDKPRYKAGDTAKLRIATKSGGKTLVAVLGNGLVASQEVDLPKGGGEVAIPVGADWGAGVYATALLYRPMSEAEKRMPSRAIGIAWLGLDPSERSLKVAIEAPEKVKSGATLELPVTIAGLAAGEEARLTVAAVDAGILNLTRFEAPAPELWFGAQRKLAMELRDFYGRLIDGMKAERGKLRSGGDGMGGGMTMHGAPTVEEIVSLYSGIVKVGPDGKAKVTFELPEFNGSVRLMAVAWSASKAGHVTKDVIVRDAVAMTVSGPRFLTLGDEARLDLSLHNVEGPATAYAIKVEEGEGTPKGVAELMLDLKTGERKSERVALKPRDVGRLTYAVRVTGPGGIDVKRRLGFDVLPPAGDIKRTTVSVLKEKGGRLTLSRDLLQDLIPSRTRITLGVGPAASLDVAGLLNALDRYPYGCAEQTVSRALPLLYVNAVAAGIGLGADKEIRQRVQGAVDRVLEMQDASGAFGIWGPQSADMWLTSYVMDFLTRAKETGYQIPARPYAQGLDRLANYLGYAQDFEKGGEARAYALYVLARNGRAPTGELRYYADTRLDRFATPLAKAQLGAALLLAGDKERAGTVFKAAFDHMAKAEKDAAARADYGSGLRDGAALVTLAAETGIAKAETPKLVSVVAKAYQSRTYTSTQEQAWMLLAANALGDHAREMRLTVAGRAHQGSLVRSVSQKELESGLTVSNDGDAAVDAVVTVIGASLTPEPAVAKGFKIERSAYTLDGKKVDLKSLAGGAAEMKRNDRLVMVLRIEAKEKGGRLLLVDRLPAGLEIENPRLVEGGDIKSLDWLKTSVKPEHTEFRDDRFVAAFNFFGNGVRQEASVIEGGDEEGDAPAADATQDNGKKGSVAAASVAYIVRAVTPGSFVHPAATIEDMYRPERHARTASGRLVVKE